MHPVTRGKLSLALAACAAVTGFLCTSFHKQLWASSTIPGVAHTNSFALAPRDVSFPLVGNNMAPNFAAPGSGTAGAYNRTYFSTFTEASKFVAAATLFLTGAVVLARAVLFPCPAPISICSGAAEKRDESLEKMRQMVNSLDSIDMRVLSRGGSMAEVVRSRGIDEIAKAIRADQASRKDLTPKDVILEMQRGNGRFWMGLSERPDMTALERRALIMAQAPKICILSCSDSRVPVEIIFDQGLGEVFVVRMAGNILDANAHGSIEFAVQYLGVKAVMVLGHEACGAVKGAITMSQDDIAKEPFDLQVVLQNIKSGLNIQGLSAISDGRARDREAIVENVSNQVKKLQQNQLMAEKMEDGSLLICGAFYEISSGIVDFFSLDKNGLVIDV